MIAALIIVGVLTLLCVGVGAIPPLGGVVVLLALYVVATLQK